MRPLLILLAAPLFAQSPGLDLMLLVEGSPGMQSSFSPADLQQLRSDDHAALMAFSTKTRLIQPFTNDQNKIRAALHRSVTHSFGPTWPRSPKALVYRALRDAAREFQNLPADPTRRRAVVLIFATDDESQAPSLDELKREFAAPQIRLYVIAVRKYDFAHARDSRIETPPTIPGRTPPAPTDRAPLPLSTLRVLRQLADASGGEASSDEATAHDLIGHVRSGPDQPEKLRFVPGEHGSQSGIAEVPSH